jgi:hypothetical protein
LDGRQAQRADGERNRREDEVDEAEGDHEPGALG